MKMDKNKLNDALVTAGAAFVLALPLFGFRLEDSSNGIYLSFRFEWVFCVAIAVFVGRLIIVSFKIPGFSITLPKLNLFQVKIFKWLLLLLTILFPFFPGVDRNIIDKVTLILIYVMLGWGLNIVVGLAGLLDLGYVAFYAVGAYSYALLSINFDLSFWICLPLAGLLAAIFGLMLGFPVLRLRGDYLAIVTLGFGEIIRIILVNWQDLTGGPNGITSIPRPTLFGLHMSASAPDGAITLHEFLGIEYNSEHRIIFLYFLILFLALVTNLFTIKIRSLPLGRAWEALREDEIACKALGLNPTNIKLSAFALGAMFAGFAGSFFATRQGFISPESFTFIESAIILAIVVLGGLGSQVGVVLAASILIGIPEIFREFNQFRMLAFGMAMVLVMIWRPNGLISGREPSIKLGINP